ncbi:phosphatase and actin regulator 2 isoform X1 [Lepisosteus oculatus]|uniref:phosphatase and actin regulator 2 isoform X1 n=1 Tax=Lepisosteus oculatus TaxID=7918 RepID=UPI0007405278|nr:PREDICTED: phosphatase and actin regulator 2 isoform X1 [Lepisosteus oculatus]
MATEERSPDDRAQRPPVRPLQRVRSQSDTSGFIRARILNRLITASSVDGLEKVSLANSDVAIPGSQTPPLKQKGKLSSLGKIFKPWKWRKKKTSDKFQDLSKVLERKISTRQSREELIRRGVLIPDQDGAETVNSGTSNGHTVPVRVEPVAEEVRVDIETPCDSALEEKPERTDNRPVPKTNPPRTQDTPAKKSQLPPKAHGGAVAGGARKEGAGAKKLPKGSNKQPLAPSSKQSPRNGNRANAKSSHPKKSAAAAAKAASPSSSSSSSTAQSRSPREGARAKTGGSGTPRPEKKPERRADSAGAPTDSPPRTGAPTPGSPPLAAGQDPAAAEAARSSEEASARDPAASRAGQEASSAEETPGQSGEQPPGPPAAEASPPSQAAPEPRGDPEECGSRPAGGDPPSPSVPREAGGAGSENGEDRVRVGIPDSPEVTVIPDDKENHASDSDSDGPILYRDEEEEEDEEDEYTSSSLASKIRRRDTLAIKLGNRPSKRELEEKNILPRTSEEERQELRQQIGTKLVRRLSQRPTTEELEQRNILKQKNEEEEHEAKQEIKRRLSRKLSVRPTVAELVARRILRFNEYVEVTDAKDYDRRADKPWTRLTPADKAAIRKELNEFKSKEMAVHEESRQFTRYHRP